MFTTHFEAQALINAIPSTPQPRSHLLQGYDLEMVIEALRRDMRHQEFLSHGDGPFAGDAAFAARKSRDLLELLNPKQPTQPIY